MATKYVNKNVEVVSLSSNCLHRKRPLLSNRTVITNLNHCLYNIEIKEQNLIYIFAKQYNSL